LLVCLPPSSSPPHRGCLWVTFVALCDACPLPCPGLPSFRQVGGGPVYHHDPSTHHQPHYGPPTPPPRLPRKERTPPGPVSTTWRLGPHFVADSVCSGEQPAAEGLGPHKYRPCFCPFSMDSVRHRGRLMPTSTTPPTRQGTICDFGPALSVSGCTPAVQVCLVMLSLGTYPPFWPLALTCSRPLLGLEG
jgi:hypothetical protein